MPGARAQEARPGPQQSAFSGMASTGDVQPSIYDDLRSEDRYLQKLQSSDEQELANNYFANKRVNHLLNKTQENKSRGS